MITLKERIRLIFIDWITIIIVIIILFLPFIIYDIINENNKIGESYINSQRASQAYTIYNFFVFSVFLNKDVFLGKSIGKRIGGFQIVGFYSNKISSPLICLLRNCTILIWPVEVVFVMINPNRRLGDYLAGTVLIKQKEDLIRSHLNYWQVFISLSIPILIMMVVKLLIYGSLK